VPPPGVEHFSSGEKYGDGANNQHVGSNEEEAVQDLNSRTGRRV
jgi:hypothetical protein